MATTLTLANCVPKLAARLGGAGSCLQFAGEVGPGGVDFHRLLAESGDDCVILATSAYSWQRRTRTFSISADNDLNPLDAAAQHRA